MDPRRQSPQEKRVDQIEIIERTVEESRRPLTSAELIAFQPQSSVWTSNEQILFPDSERRFQLTSERDADRDSSLLYSPSAGRNSFVVREAPLQQSTPEQRQHGLNQYGHDVHEVLTSGGARVVKTHESGQLMLDRSVGETGGATVLRTPPREDTTKSILKTVPPMASPEGTAGDASWRKSPSSEGSVQRKNSYRRMQDKQEEEEVEAQQQPSFHGHSSNATIVSKGSKQKWPEMFGAEHRGKASMARLKESVAELSQQMSEGEWTPRLVTVLCLAVLFLLLVLLLLWLLVSSLFLHRSTFAFWLYPPPCEECQRRNGGAPDNRSPSRLFVHLDSPAQAHFELIGNPPFKSNSFTAIDFDTGFVAIADHALTDERGRHSICFMMELDKSALPDLGVVQDALSNTYREVHSQFGWQEYWQYVAEEVDPSFVAHKFRDRIDDCQKATKWYQLKHTVYTRDSTCYNCYDFCLPDYAVLRRQKYEDKVSLGIRRLNCFRLYVSEWEKYQLQTDPSGGHWHYPLHTAHHTQRDAEGNWVNWQYGEEAMKANQRKRRRRSILQKELKENAMTQNGTIRGE
uniref:BRICHOS domain-containing protein n=1 Tax=Globodera rostochiensis TaxID=31243 RepID=A0A914GXK6_GLORO